MKLSKNNILFIFLVFANFQPTFAHDFSVNLIKNRLEKEAIANEVTKKNKNHEVDKDQIVFISNYHKEFIIAPTISTAETSGGCYLQTLNTEYKLETQYLIEKNVDSQSCDSIIAIFGCRLPQKNGIGIIVGMRLGSNNYYTQSSFFELDEKNELKENLLLSKKIGAVDSVTKAKKKLACIK